MLDTVRRSKITPPRLPAAPVARPRVDALLDAAAAKPVTLVSASAGYGKTSAVEAWLTTRRVPAAWVSVDAHDNDALHLWRYVIASVERALPDFDEAPRSRVLLAESTAEPTIEVLLAALEDDGRPLTIVLDDLHLVTDRRALDSLRYAAVRLPPAVRLVLITRVDPPLRLAYLRAAGRLAELRDAELAFTSEEAASLLGPAASEEAEARCEGWPVALRLVALRGAVPVTGRRRDVAAYLTAEVVDGLPDDLRGFLERTSMLPRLSVELCDHVLERDDSAALLDRVVRANLFVVALDEDGLWWRYHALFAEYLRLRLGERAAALHHRACDWFERHGLYEDAVDHAAACGDVEMIARTLEAQQVRMSRSGRAATIERWLELLPHELVSARPGVLTAGALAAGGLARPRAEVRRMLNRAERASEQHPEEWSGYHEAARVLLAALYGDDDVALTLERSVRAVELARADADTLVVPAMAVLAWARLLAGEDDAALELARATEVHPDADRRPFGVVAALAVQAVIAAERENPVVAERLAGRALFEATRAGVLQSTAAGCAHFAAALGALADGRPVDAERALHRARTIEAAIDGGAMHAWVLATYARTLAARGRTRRAELALEEARGVLAACIDPGAVAARVERAAAAVAALEGAAPTVTEALSPAELSVLRHFEGDRTARAIGADLYVSINTVKTHIRAIYRKLGVSTREDALARAKALDLLDV